MMDETARHYKAVMSGKRSKVAGEFWERMIEAYYEKMAQPDYKGTLAGGRAVVFEAKHTDSDRLQRSVISSEQEKQLDRHEKLGADCFVMVSFRFEQYFKVPWGVFRDMKSHFGRKYITPEDVQGYKVRYTGGVIHFL